MTNEHENEQANPTEPKVKVEVKGHVLVITFNRPHKYNALDPESFKLLAKAFYRLEHEHNLRVGILQAAGDNFSSGLELDKWAPIFAKGIDFTFEDDELDPFSVEGAGFTKPLICAAQGLCYTSGLELLLNTDIRIATANTRFSQLEVKRGIYACRGGTIRLPKEIGWSNAQRYLLTGDEFTAEQALNWGMIQEIVPQESLHLRALELAEKVAKAAPLGVQASLRSSKLARKHSQELAFAHVSDDMAELMTSKDAKEGVMSFLERREAKFIGE
ncbi:crotonase/enoyl-CoA hydratase family protein [Litoribacillus peritrichatus]|uniref:Crotonase/enoyl-CoA hydratase family protein n=1 Tax=Litoribacillus peritrichatus TaxID=718191 RepID=A0ABP7N576_9GAMM